MKQPFIILLGLATHLSAADFKEGTLTLLIKRGEREQTVLYTKKGEQLRLEYPGKHIPAKPYNIINTQSGEVKIARPLNSTWSLIPAKRLAVRKPSASPIPAPPAPAAGIGARPGPAGVAGVPPRPIAPTIPPTTAPKLPASAGVKTPAIPKVPTPTLPDGSPLPKGIGPQPAGAKTQPGTGVIPSQRPGIPGGIPGGLPGGLPGGPPMMPGQAEKMKLIKGKESKTIHGYLCHRYLMTLPGEGEMTLWLSDAKGLPPFYLPLYRAPRARGRVDWRQQWPAVLREKKLFPMLAILRVATEKTRKPAKTDPAAKKKAPKQGREIVRWQVTDISAKAIPDTEKTLFVVPKNYHRLESPNF